MPPPVAVPDVIPEKGVRKTPYRPAEPISGK